MAKSSKIASKLQSKLDESASRPRHIIVVARAGTGKTSTAIGGLQVMKGLNAPFTPSTQQEAIWAEMMLSKSASSIVCVAFNKSIAVELQSRVPMGVEASTMHSLGFKAVTKTFGRLQPTQWNVADIIGRLLRKDCRDIRRDNPVLLSATQALVSRVKSSLVEPTPENLDLLASRYDVELNGSRSAVYDLVPQVIRECKQPSKAIDFDDMVWLPIVLDLPLFRYDFLIQDEAQDLSPCQQQLSIRSGRRIMAIGDNFQSLYGFAGADTESIQRMQETLSATPEGCVSLPLTVTRRCGKAIVEEAQQYVPDFQAHESNGLGKVSEAKYPLQGPKGSRKELPYEKTYMPLVDDGDFVICRVNAPLVSQCFRFLKRGRKATIQGRDIGAGILSLVEKMKATSLVDLQEKLGNWYSSECEKESKKKFPSDARLIALEDKLECLMAFCDSVCLLPVENNGSWTLQTDKVNGENAFIGSYRSKSEAEQAKGIKEVEVVRKRIENVFTDDKNSPGVRLSSIHRAKGLEAKKVFFLMPEEGPCPHPMAKQKWEREGEICCLYVGITRAIEELVYVY